MLGRLERIPHVRATPWQNSLNHSAHLPKAFVGLHRRLHHAIPTPPECTVSLKAASGAGEGLSLSEVEVGLAQAQVPGFDPPSPWQRS